MEVLWLYVFNKLRWSSVEHTCVQKKKSSGFWKAAVPLSCVYEGRQQALGKQAADYTLLSICQCLCLYIGK